MANMKLKKSDIGSKFIIVEWHRGVDVKAPKGDQELSSVGRVNIVIGGKSLRIDSSDEFCVLASERHLSDSWVKIYRSESDIKSANELNELQRWFTEYARSSTYSNSKLSMSQLKGIKTIIEGKE